MKYYEDRNEFITNDGTILDIYDDILDIVDELPDNIKNKVLDKI